MKLHQIANLPNLLTLSRIFATPLFLGLLFAESWHWRSLAVFVFAAAAVTDFYDGKLARAGNQVTEFGRFMDPLADKLLVTSALVALVLGRIVHTWIVVPIVVRDVAITGMRLYGIYHGRMMETTRLAKWKTTVQLVTVVAILFLIGLQELAARFQWDSLMLDEEWLALLTNGLMAAVLLLTLLSGFHYFLRTG